MSPEAIAQALGGRWNGSSWMACCPAHDDHTPSLSIGTGDNGNTIVHCFASCSQDAVLAALRERGLEVTDRGSTRSVKIAAKSRRIPDPVPSTFALSVWKESKPTTRSLAEVYLASRGLNAPGSHALRFHPGLKDKDSGMRWPAMVALVTRGNDGLPMSIHRTFLARDGKGKAPLEQPRQNLGPCKGNSIRLAEPTASGLLLVGEGIETCLAAMQATGIPAWAAGSAPFLGAMILPRQVRDVIVLVDGDRAGHEAANLFRAWHRRQGRRVRLACAPDGMDFNDIPPVEARQLVERAT